MNIQITKIKDTKKKVSTALLFSESTQIPAGLLQRNEAAYLNSKLEKEEEEIVIHSYPNISFFQKISGDLNQAAKLEKARSAGGKLFKLLKTEGLESVQLLNFCDPELMSAFVEGILLASYSFTKYFTKKEEYALKQIFVNDVTTTDKQLQDLAAIDEAVFVARDLVNEPLSTLSAVKLASEISKYGEKAGFDVEVFNHQKIKSLKMGGLLAVNKGSIDPPTFSVLEWKPKNARNKKPLLLVGKGIVYDTGGMSLKPTPNSMDYMKSDMGGAAAVIGALYALAKIKSPIHVIGLIPATDNRPDGNAYVPGDIITMFDGTTVEIKNTDAEGRLILADALSYAKKFDPELVIDLATLTGSAAVLSGSAGAAIMGNSPKNIQRLKEIGDLTHERLIELPLWDDFKKPLKSPIADLNNLGTREGQTMIAGKFLEHFTAYPWIHLDIAGPAFIFEDEAYRPKGGTGIGTRLLVNFINSMA